jgi:hypothetical protein
MLMPVVHVFSTGDRFTISFVEAQREMVYRRDAGV